MKEDLKQNTLVNQISIVPKGWTSTPTASLRVLQLLMGMVPLARNSAFVMTKGSINIFKQQS